MTKYFICWFFFYSFENVKETHSLNIYIFSFFIFSSWSYSLNSQKITEKESENDCI